MNFPLAVIFSGMAAISPLAAAAQEPPPPPADEQPVRDIATLVRELSDESFRVREKATSDIWRMGDSVLEALTEAAASSDPEQAFRARDLLRKIQLHITPDTDPSVIALVERYLKATPSEKASLLGKMKGKRAWRQMLKLYASETNAELREKLQEFVSGVAVIAARERLAKGDPETAREFLEMAPADSAGLLALAEFHRSHGSLDEELKRAEAVPGRKSALWQLALHRASGNLQGARDAALEAGENRIAAAMSALEGDPIPWLRGAPEGFEEDDVAAAYAVVASKRWLGQKVRPGDLAPMIEGLSSRRAPERGAAMNALSLLNEVDLVEPTFIKADPFSAFQHFQLLERNADALKALGLDPAKPDFKPWVEKRIAKLTADDIEDQHDPSTHVEELVAVANFLERRGLHDEAFAAFSGPLAALAEKDENEYIDFLGKLFTFERADVAAPILAKRIGVPWAADNADRWDELVIAALGDDDVSPRIWTWFSEIAPKESRAERFDGLLAVFDIGSDPAKLRGKWMDRAWKAIAAAGEGERASLLELISAASFRAGDAANSLKAWKMMPEKAREDFNWEQRLLLLSATDQWDEAATVILEQLGRFAEAKQVPPVELHAYSAAVLRRAGREEEAAVHDAWVDKFALGNSILAAQIARIYAFGGDKRRTHDWFARSVREADPDSSEFLGAMELYSTSLLENGSWLEAASTSEVVARYFASAGYNWTKPLIFMHQRLQADLARSLANLTTNRAQSIATLEKLHKTFISDGLLADYFFPSLRKEGLINEHDRWFLESWERFEDVIEQYPESENIRNTLAWFASRSMRKLDEAEKHLKKALDANPDQPAYLDTMAEIQFARGDRAEALKWSRKALNFDPNDEQLRGQYERFRSDPLPK